MVRSTYTAMLVTVLGSAMGSEDGIATMGNATVAEETCAVHFVAGGALCGEAAMPCAFLSQMPGAFAEGYCADAGESLQQINTFTFSGVTLSAFVGNFGGNALAVNAAIKVVKHLEKPSLKSSSKGLIPKCNIYNEAADYGIPCGEVNLECQYVPLVKLLRPFKSGKCANAGFKVQAHAWPIKIPIFGDISFTIFAETQPSTKQCSVNLPAGLLCGEVTTSCDLIPALKDFVGFQEGECSSDSFKVIPGSAGDVFEGVTVSAFIDKTVDVPEVSGKTCSVYDLGDTWALKHAIPCGQVTMDCSLVPHAKLLRDTIKDGECADAGYAHEQTSLWARTLWVPLAGDVVIKVFDKAKIHSVLV